MVFEIPTFLRAKLRKLITGIKLVNHFDFVVCCHWIILNNKSNKSRENNLISYELKSEKHGWRQSDGHDIPYKTLHRV